MENGTLFGADRFAIFNSNAQNGSVRKTENTK